MYGLEVVDLMLNQIYSLFQNPKSMCSTHLLGLLVGGHT